MDSELDRTAPLIDGPNTEFELWLDETTSQEPEPSEEEMERLQDLANRQMAKDRGMTLEEFKKWSEDQMKQYRDDVPF